MSRSQAPPSILDRPLGRPAGSGGGRGSSGSGEGVSLSAFAYLYSELVQYHQSRVAWISELERRLESAGYGVGLRVLELLAYRAREVSLMVVPCSDLVWLGVSFPAWNVVGFVLLHPTFF